MKNHITTQTDASTNNGFTISSRAFIPFLLIAFGLCWGILALFIYLPDPMTRLFGELTGTHPLFYIATWSPAIAAFTVVISRTGLGGLKRFLSRLLLWRCSVWWYLFIFVGIPLVFIAGSMIKGNFSTENINLPSLPSLLTVLLLTAIKGPVEELGWRGVALPIIQRRFTPFSAAIILGVIWGIWHFPAFLLSGTQQSEWSFGAFFLGCIALSVLVTPLFNAARGSILLSAFFHFMLINPYSPDAQPYDTYILVAIAVVVVILNRRALFQRAVAVNAVVPPAHSMLSH